MTRNQIDYAKHKEDVRHNLEEERLKVRDQSIGLISAQAARDQAVAAKLRQAEDARHNRQSEVINWFGVQAPLQEQRRHNLAGESIASREQGVKEQTLAESIRHNTAQESISRFSAQAQKQVGMAQAAAAQMSAHAAGLSAQANLANASTNALNAQTRQSELAESIRHAQVQEGQNERDVITREKSIPIQQTEAAAKVTSAEAQAVRAAAAAQDAETRRVQAIFTDARQAAGLLGDVSGLARSILGG